MTVALYAHCTVLKIIIVKFQKHLDRNYRERNLLNVSKYDKKTALFTSNVRCVEFQTTVLYS